jgi:predicted membrane-bound mannosyltransferase/DNA-binding beta-propeller fold protein YncE
MTTTEEKRSWLDRPLSNYFPSINIEVLLFVLIVILAAVSRFYDLGVRVMSHDESLHTYFSWWFYQGNGYQHNPMMHGPLQFHLLALTYFLFGATDFTARLPHAVSSILTIVLLWKYRRYLGRAGTLAASVLMLISPYMLYYGRYARNEAFVGLFGLLMLYAMLRYLETGKNRYLYLLTTATVLHFTAKETAFIYVAQALLLMAIYFIARVTQKPWQKDNRFVAFIIALAIGVLLLGSTFGYVLYSRGQVPLDTAQTAAPAIPSQTASSQPVSPLTATSQLLSPTTLLAGASLIAFILAGLFLVTGYGWKAIRAERSFDMLMLLGTLVLPLLTAFPLRFTGGQLFYKDPSNPTNILVDYSSANLWHIGLYFLAPMVLIAILVGLWWNKRVWIKNAALFYGIFIFFYTTVFTNGVGFFSGLVGSLDYWIVQQGVNRGSQPWYYYLLIQIPVYEFLPALGIFIGFYYGLRRRSPLPLPIPAGEPDPEPDTLTTNSGTTIGEGNHTFSLLAWWSLSSLLAYTIAGEKMPWLTFHIALPMILFTAWGLGQVIERTEWAAVRQKRGLLVVIALGVFLISFAGALIALLGPNPPFQGKELLQLAATSSFLFALLSVIASGVGLFYLLKDWEFRQFVRLGALTSFSLLAILTARAAFRAAYINYDYATEYLVYAHGEAGIKDVMNQIGEISRRTAGSNNLVVAYDVSAPDTGVSWPFTWYLRDYSNLRPFDQPTRELRDASVIIVDQKNFANIEPVVGDAYVRLDYLRMVWPNQDYFGLTWERIRNAITNPEIRDGILQIWLNRDYTVYAKATGSSYLTLPTWEPSDKMRLYIRKDIAAQIWSYGVRAAVPVEADPYEKGMIALPAELSFGITGQADGQLNGPRGIAIAPDGSLYVADMQNDRIQHFDQNGQVLQAWGSTSPGCPYPGAPPPDVPTDTFCQPWDVAVSPDGRWVYVADTWNHRIMKFTANGTLVKTWAHAYYGQDDPEGIWGPRGLAVDAIGRVFVADTGNKRIVIFDADGNYLTQFGSPGLLPGQFDEPVGLTFDGSGNLYVADTWNQRVQVFSPSLDGLTFSPLAQWDLSAWYGQSLDNKPYLAADGQGHVFITDPEASRILEFNAQGNFVRGWGDNAIGLENIGLATGIAVDAQGRVWVSDARDNRLMRFTLPGAPSTTLNVPSLSPSPVVPTPTE